MPPREDVLFYYDGVQYSLRLEDPNTELPSMIYLTNPPTSLHVSEWKQLEYGEVRPVHLIPVQELDLNQHNLAYYQEQKAGVVAQRLRAQRSYFWSALDENRLHPESLRDYSCPFPSPVGRFDRRFTVMHRSGQRYHHVLVDSSRQYMDEGLQWWIPMLGLVSGYSVLAWCEEVVLQPE